MSAADSRRIAVIGGGIDGLTLAIALRRHGIVVDIYEQTAERARWERPSRSRQTEPASSSSSD